MIVSTNVSPDVVPPVPLTHFLLTTNAWVLAICSLLYYHSPGVIYQTIKSEPIHSPKDSYRIPFITFLLAGEYLSRTKHQHLQAFLPYSHL